ncbi:DESI1 [Hepatospora eriocheir]|uniref:DESI1 n=1 Tax=Hepatospora eriocheir TaxID=1081669 RepID=A0A1X0QLN8_9MICR|nr:DESI1 [Hepatospora eriocheir]
MAGKEGIDFYLKVYDLFPHLNKQHLSRIAGFEIEAIWHTAIEVDGDEYFFGKGIIKMDKNVMYGTGAFIEKIYMGRHKTEKKEFEEFLNVLNESLFSHDKYHVLNHNCNHFTNFLSNHFFKRDIPKKILELAEKGKDSKIVSFIFNNKSQFNQ